MSDFKGSIRSSTCLWLRCLSQKRCQTNLKTYRWVSFDFALQKEDLFSIRLNIRALRASESSKTAAGSSAGQRASLGLSSRKLHMPSGDETLHSRRKPNTRSHVVSCPSLFAIDVSMMAGPGGTSKTYRYKHIQ